MNLEKKSNIIIVFFTCINISYPVFKFEFAASQCNRQFYFLLSQKKKNEASINTFEFPQIVPYNLNKVL